MNQFTHIKSSAGHPALDKFSLPAHGTMFIYPLQARLYEIICSAVKESHRNDKRCLLSEEWLINQLLKYGYGIKGIKSEISRSCYAAIFTQIQQGDMILYKPTQWGLSLIDNIFNEISWQPGQVIVKLTRRSSDKYNIIIRDTSFLSLNIRNFLSEIGFKTRHIYELCWNGINLEDIIKMMYGLLAMLGKNSSMYVSNLQESGNNIDALLTLINIFGREYRSISDKYVHYNIPNQHTWYVSPSFDLLCMAIMDIAKRPLEWRGRTFTKDDLFSKISALPVESLDIPRLNRWFGYLLSKSFVRQVDSSNLFTLTGQGAIWLKAYFQTIWNNFSQLDLTICHIDNETYWLRLANATYLPDELIALLKTTNIQEKAGWFYLYKATGDEICNLLKLVSPTLTVWRHKGGGS